ncbi:hypothetical protein H0E87_031579 [Populus deltoides]|uniref:Transmembrane protein n=1 Tax=Populus deltoides TaxID=3696 RepID=A0A8T2WFT7_POPDE|nr:hypothetical protein H0E87_031579 [Populus deltoides]
MLRAGRAWFLISAWVSCCPLFLVVSALICFGCNLDGPPLCMSLHGLSFNLDGWELLIGYTSFSGCDDERARHALACGLICLVLQLLVAFVDTGPDGFLRLCMDGYALHGWLAIVSTWAAKSSSSLHDKPPRLPLLWMLLHVVPYHMGGSSWWLGFSFIVVASLKCFILCLSLLCALPIGWFHLSPFVCLRSLSTWGYLYGGLLILYGSNRLAPFFVCVDLLHGFLSCSSTCLLFAPACGFLALVSPA